ALRNASRPYPEICIHLFEGSTSNDFDSWGPSSTLPHHVEEVYDHNLNGLESIECTQIEPVTQGVSEESSGQSKKRRKKKVKETLNSKLIEVGDHITKVAKMLIEKQNLSNDIDACMEKLGTLGWEEFDAKYQQLFCFLVRVLILGKCGHDFNRTHVSFGLGMQKQRMRSNQTTLLIQHLTGSEPLIRSDLLLVQHLLIQILPKSPLVQAPCQISMA
ncbi:hypothetical protein R6Q57_000829, partial [Mikania cordata]